MENLNIELSKEPSIIESKKVCPVKIGSQIVGSNHFNEYDIRVDQLGVASIQTLNSQSPRDAKETL